MSRMTSVFALDDFERRARLRLPKPIFAFVQSGAEDQQALNENLASFSQWSLTPRSLVDVSVRSQATKLFGTTYSSSFGIAPMGGGMMCGYQVDLALARAAGEAEIPFILSGASTTALEAVVDQAPRSWFQAYLAADLGRIDGLLERLRRARVEVLVVTTDVPVMGNRENALRAGFSMPPVFSPRLLWEGVSHPAWLFGCLVQTLVRDGVPRQANFDADIGDSILAPPRASGDWRSRLTWEHVRHIRRSWRGRLILKGVLSVEDARQARAVGADGVIVSNHGGRQLSSAVAPMHVLPQIRDAARDMVVLIDGGLRRGGDVLKARAAGADFVLVGRPFLYAAAVAGQAGVSRAIAILRQEIDRDLALIGCPDFKNLDAGWLQDSGMYRAASGGSLRTQPSPRTKSTEPVPWRKRAAPRTPAQ